jgi:DNA-binding NtrC family response regulator
VDLIDHNKEAEHQSIISTLEEENFQRFKELTEKIFVELKLKEHQWNIAKTAESIGIQRSHLYNKIERYQLSKPKTKI